MTRPALSKRQVEALDYIRRHLTQHGYAPSLREIMGAMRITSPNGVVCHIRALAEKGYIKFDKSTARSLRLVEDGHVDIPTISADSSGVRVCCPDRVLSLEEAKALAAKLTEAIKHIEATRNAHGN